MRFVPIVFSLLFSILLFNSVKAQNFSINKAETTMMVEGTSTVRDWNAKLSNAAQGGADIDIADGSVTFKSLKVSFPVHSLQSSEGNTMNKHMWESLKADENKNISFELTEFVGFSKLGEAIVKGKWTMAGSTKTVTLRGKVNILSGNVSVTGSTELDITEFNMEPPSLFFDTMNVDPKMTISYTIVLKSS